MKVFISILLFLNFVLRAQQNTEGVFSLRPALGINACQVHGDSYSGFHKAGIFGGVAVNTRFSSRASLDIGFYFSQKGARHNPNPEKGDYNFYFLNLNYIDLPFSLNYQLNKDYFITLGPSIAYLASYYEEINYVNYTGSYNFNKFEYGVNLGLGKKIKERFFVEVRTSNSIYPIRGYGGFTSTVFYPNPIAQFFNKGFYNNVLTIFASYKLTLKKKTSAQQ
ncbi:MAG: PorT family protein [Bacteroidetes bacterium]|nr:PorT family protein [Bacteroidota bacterium]